MQLSFPVDYSFAHTRFTIMRIMMLRFVGAVVLLCAFFTYQLVVFGVEHITQHTAVIFSVILASVLVSELLIVWIGAPMLRFFYLKGEKNIEDVSEKVIRNTLNFPLYLGVIDFFTWIIFGSGIALYLISLNQDQLPRFMVHVFMCNIFTGQVGALFSFYLSEYELGKRIWPWMMQGKKVSQIGGVIAVPSFVRIMIMVFTSVICPMVFLYMIESVGDGSGDILLFTLVTTVVVALWQGLFLMASISSPLGKLEGFISRLKEEKVTESTGVYNANAIGKFAEALDDLVDTMEERDFVRSTFSRYMSQQVVDEILGGKVDLGGDQYDATVLFADIRGFTSLSEKMPAEDVVELLNEYLDCMVTSITNYHGLPDKFIGDGILAVWGVPNRGEDHVENAFLAALDMIAALKEFNDKREGDPIRIGIGLHCGDLIAGNIGSKRKMEFTVIGDTVNTCSRIESITKELGSPLVVSEDVYTRLPVQLQSKLVKGEEVILRGKEKGMRVYLLADT